MITKEARDLAVTKSQTGGLVNLTELALVLGVGRDYMKAMIRAGFMTFGGRTTCEDALQWLRANPDFKTRQHQHSAKSSRKLSMQQRNGAIRKRLPVYVLRFSKTQSDRHANRKRPALVRALVSQLKTGNLFRPMPRPAGLPTLGLKTRVAFSFPLIQLILTHTRVSLYSQ